MKPIYEPKGAAKEYGDLALNIYTGCPHRCFYCFAPSVLRREREAFHTNVQPREGIVEATRRQLEKEQITGKLMEEAIKTLCELLQNAEVMLQELVENLFRFVCSSNEEQLSIPFQKPYHCRACGRRYATPKEVRLCMRLHQKGRADIKASARFQGKHARLRVAPRNREATMRSTEIRKYKQTSRGAGRR